MTTRKEAKLKEQRLEGFLFDLMRDHVPAGKLAKLVQELEDDPPPYKYEVMSGQDEFTNSLAGAARALAQRILDVKGKEDT